MAEPKKRGRSNRDTRQRFEQWARNPQCGANVVSAVHNIKMGAAARHENPQAPQDGQSVFALTRGVNFEAGLIRDHGRVLLTALQRTGVLESSSSEFMDLRTTANGGKIRDLDAAIVASSDFLQTLGKGRQFNGAVSSCALRIPRGILLPEATLIIDVLTVQIINRRAVICVGEIKTYPDRGGLTSRSDLASARAQMGLYVHALQIVLQSMNIEGDIDVSTQGFLVLTYPGSNQPSVQSGEELHYQVERARRGFALMEASAQSMPTAIGSGDDTDPSALLNLVVQAPISFNESCVSFCERANACFDKELQRGNGSILGDDVERFLNGLSLIRAEELMTGTRPKNIVEEDFLARFNDPLPNLP